MLSLEYTPFVSFLDSVVILYFWSCRIIEYELSYFKREVLICIQYATKTMKLTLVFDMFLLRMRLII